MRRRLQAGFTLIELMVVLVIIGVLAALIVPNVLDRADDARVTAAKTDVNNLMQALKLYRLDNQRYPTAEQGLQALLTKPTTAPVPPNWKPYLDKLPNDPWGIPTVPQPRHQGRDRRDVLWRRRPGRRRGQKCGYWQLATDRVGWNAPRGLNSSSLALTKTSASRGFTLLELLVVVAIIAMATAGVGFALRDTSQTQLEREAQRLAALLESARAQFRVASGVPVRWRATPTGFRFEGLAPSAQPMPDCRSNGWSPAYVRGRRPATARGLTLLLGPDPIIGPQQVRADVAHPAGAQRAPGHRRRAPLCRAGGRAP